jgi:hypothetical protein
MSETDKVTDDELKQTIKDTQDKEISYILEASQIDDKRSKYLAKKNEYKIIFEDGKEETFKRKPLTSKKNKEIDDLRSAFASNRLETKTKVKVNGKEFDNIQDVLYEAFKKTAEYCLGLTADQYDSGIWEDDPEYMKKDIYGLRSVLGACLLRAVHGVAYFPQP